MLPGSRYDDKSPAAAERVAALDAALDNGGDLWQFGTQTLKAFSDRAGASDRSGWRSATALVSGAASLAVAHGSGSTRRMRATPCGGAHASVGPMGM